MSSTIEMIQKISPNGEISPESDLLEPLVPHMQPDELNLFSKYLQEAKIYVEFGCGGSTYHVLDFDNIEQIHSVESDGNWLERLKAYPKIQQALKAERLHLYHGDIGPVGKWGVPKDTSKIQNWPKNYYWGIWRQLPQEPDFILIDGRFRVATALVVCMLFNQVKKLKIAIHDFTKREHQYSIVRDFLTPVVTEDTLVIFTIKPDLNFQHLFLTLCNYLYNSR